MALKLNPRMTKIFHWALVAFGCILLGFSTAIFFTKNSIVSGGLSGIGIVVQYLFDPEQNTVIVDIVVWSLSIILWLISLFFIGKDFAMKTLLASILYPMSLSVFLRVPIFDEIASSIAGSGDTGDLLICSIFGGLLTGISISITFIGKGSTGGLDVISFLVNKIFGFRVSIVSLSLDVLIIFCSMFLLNFPYMIANSLSGIISASMMAIMIQMLYSKRENAILMDVISTKADQIKEYILVDINRGCTVCDITGGYTGEKRVMLRSVVSNEEYTLIKEYIGHLDPNAFITFTPTHAVFGEGFKENISNKEKTKKLLKKSEKSRK